MYAQTFQPATKHSKSPSWNYTNTTVDFAVLFHLDQFLVLWKRCSLMQTLHVYDYFCYWEWNLEGNFDWDTFMLLLITSAWPCLQHSLRGPSFHFNINISWQDTDIPAYSDSSVTATTFNYSTCHYYKVGKVLYNLWYELCSGAHLGPLTFELVKTILSVVYLYESVVFKMK